MHNDLLAELRRRMQERVDRPFPPAIDGDAEALDLRHELMAFDARVASGVLDILAGEGPSHPRGLEPEPGLLDQVRAVVAEGTYADPAVLVQYEDYVTALETLRILAARIHADR